eukprot:5760691-Pleurochrysis_carterae.AAC.2
MLAPRLRFSARALREACADSHRETLLPLVVGGLAPRVEAQRAGGGDQPEAEVALFLWMLAQDRRALAQVILTAHAALKR